MRGSFHNLIVCLRYTTQSYTLAPITIIFTLLPKYPYINNTHNIQQNHLLKAPFCVHPGTGRVCVPIDPNMCEEFDPTSVPTLAQLLEELNTNASTGTNNYLEKTSLGLSVNFFRTCFLEPLIKTCKEELKNAYNTKIQQSKDSLNW